MGFFNARAKIVCFFYVILSAGIAHADFFGAPNYWTSSSGNINRPSGNVGVNASSPGQKLDVGGTVRSTSFVQTGSIASTFVGNVGIGSLSPGQALDVSGTVRATSLIGSHSQIFLSSGTFTPNFTGTVYVTACGAGGAGGGTVGTSNHPSGGGASGQCIADQPHSVTSGNNYTVTINAGATGGAGAGATGGTTVFDTITLNGGKGGGQGTAGADGIGGICNYGTQGSPSQGVCVPGDNGILTANGGSTFFGLGGASGASAVGGNAGANTGSGGGGCVPGDATARNGGNGGSGQVVLIW